MKNLWLLTMSLSCAGIQATATTAHSSEYYAKMSKQWESIKQESGDAFQQQLSLLLLDIVSYLQSTNQLDYVPACLRTLTILRSLADEEEQDFRLKFHVFVKNEYVLMEQKREPVPQLFKGITAHVEPQFRIPLKTAVEMLHGSIINQWLADQAAYTYEQELSHRINFLAYQTMHRMEQDIARYGRPARQRPEQKSNPFPFVASGAGTYMMGEMAEQAMFLPPVRSRLLEAAAISKAASLAATFAKPILATLVLGWLFYKGYKWFNNDSSIEAMGRQTDLRISRAEKDTRKAIAQTYEASKKLIESYHRKMKAEQAAALANLAKTQQATEELQNTVRSTIQPTVTHLTTILTEWDEFMGQYENLDQTQRAAKLGSMKRKIRAQKANLESAAQTKQKRGFFARITGCRPSTDSKDPGE